MKSFWNRRKSVWQSGQRYGAAPKPAPKPVAPAKSKAMRPRRIVKSGARRR